MDSFFNSIKKNEMNLKKKVQQNFIASSKQSCITDVESFS